MTLEQIRELVSADFEAVDRVIKEAPPQPGDAGRPSRHLYHLFGREAPTAPIGAFGGPCLWTPGGATSKPPPLSSSFTPRRCCTTTWSTVLVAPRPGDRQRGIRQSRQRLVGDFFYSRAFQMMVRSIACRSWRSWRDATNAIAEGEVLQLMNARDPDTTRSPLYRRHPPQDRAAVPSRGAVAAVLSDAPPGIEDPSHAMASTSARRSSWSTMLSTTRPTKRAWANTWGMTWRRGSPPSR